MSVFRVTLIGLGVAAIGLTAYVQSAPSPSAVGENQVKGPENGVMLAASEENPATTQAAQPTPVPNAQMQSFGNWQVSCKAAPPEKLGQTENCVLSQTLLRASDQKPLAHLTAFWSADGEKSYLSAQVPIGVYLPAGFGVRAESKTDVIPLVWQNCTPQICEALIELDRASLERLQSKEQMVLASYRPSLTSPPLLFRFSIAQIEPGLLALLAGRKN